MNLSEINESESVPLQAGFRTAIHRTSPSLPARKFLSVIADLAGDLSPEQKIKTKIDKVGDVLDFGCGRGRDVAFYLENNLDAQGYDPHREFGFGLLPLRQFHIGVTMFVLNVIPSDELRQKALTELYSLIVPRGHAMIVTRSIMAIEREAHNRNWKKWGDGYISDSRNRTFQKGLSEEEIISLGEKAGFVMANRPQPGHLRDASVVLLMKP